MPSYSDATFRSKASSKIPSRAIPRCPTSKMSSAENVRKYTEYLVLGSNVNHALMMLHELNCPIRVFEQCLTEKVLQKHYMHRHEYQYQVGLLFQKFAALRRREIATANEKFSKRGQLTPDLFSNKAVVINLKAEQEERDQRLNNELFAKAVRSVELHPKKALSKPDYSKYRIVKKCSASASTSPATSSSSN